MEQVLGVRGHFVLLCRREPHKVPASCHKVVTWTQLQKGLDLSGIGGAGRHWLERMGN